MIWFEIGVYGKSCLAIRLDYNKRRKRIMGQVMSKSRQDGAGVLGRHIDQYRKEGFCHLEGLIPPELIEATRQRLLEIIDQPPDWHRKRFFVLDPAEYRSTSDDPLAISIQRPSLEEPTFAALSEHLNLSQAMAKLLGGQVELYTDQIGIKHGWDQTEQGGRSYFHQDSWYWKIAPELGCNCWIPMQTVGKDSIALSVMPGSHTGWRLTPHESYFDDPPYFGWSSRDGYFAFKRHRVPLDQIDYSREVLVEMALAMDSSFPIIRGIEVNRIELTRPCYSMLSHINCRGVVHDSVKATVPKGKYLVDWHRFVPVVVSVSRLSLEW